ncbi:hypothetical protein V6N13_142171 [Hibiscus sabdariffa]
MGRSKSMAPTGVGILGSRFSVLSAVEDVGLGLGNAKDGTTYSTSLLSDLVVPGRGVSLTKVPVVHVGANGVHTTPDGVALRENVVGSHVVVSILDAANEKRRQRLASNGVKQPLARKSSGVGLSLGLKVRRGKENKNLACPVLDHACVASLGICGIENLNHAVPHGVEGGGISHIAASVEDRASPTLVATLNATMLYISASGIGREVHEAMVTSSTGDSQ